MSIAVKKIAGGKPPAQIVEKVCFFKIVLVLYPYKNALWALRPAKPLVVLSRHPCRNPKPLSQGKGLYYLGYPPRPSKDACSQPHKAVMQGCIKTATQSRCTMQRHKWLSMHRCNGTNGCRCTDATAQTADFAEMQNQHSKQL